MESDDTPEDRLEAALERIARIVAARPAGADASAPDVDELTARLDRVIETLRDALGK